MPATSNRIVGVIEIDSLDSLSLIQPRQPEMSRARPTSNSGSVVLADIHQLAVDLVIEFEKYERQNANACRVDD